MIVKILNKLNFCKKFLDPISNVSDHALLKLKKNNISSLVKGSDGYTYLYSESTDIEYDGDEISLNIGDLKRFIKILLSIPEDNLSIIINANNIEYKSPTNKFKFHLMEDGIINVPSLSVEKIEMSKFCTFFKLPILLFSNLLKSSSYVLDGSKIYIHTENGMVLGELNDMKKDNTDSYSMKIAETFEGDEILEPLPFSTELFRSISTLKSNEFDVKINVERRIIAISILEDNYILKWFATGLVG